MSMHDVAQKLVEQLSFPKAEKYDLYLRDYDNQVEILGYVPDPNYNIKDFEGREMLFPKRWITLGVVPASTKVPA